VRAYSSLAAGIRKVGYRVKRCNRHEERRHALSVNSVREGTIRPRGHKGNLAPSLRVEWKKRTCILGGETKDRRPRHSR